MNEDYKLSKEEQDIVKKILDIEDFLFFNNNTLNIKEKNNLLYRKEAKELTLYALSIEKENYSKEDLNNVQKFFNEQIKIRINIILSKNIKSIFENNIYAGKNIIFHLVNHNDVKLLKTYFFKNQIQDLSGNIEDLTLISIKNNNPQIFELLLHYNHKIDENNINYIKKFIEDNNTYNFNEKIYYKITKIEEKMLLEKNIKYHLKNNKKLL